ncbi:MAG TPA: DHH family phosphoesterase [Polyangiaceae bacterium]|nr:DHH family phosphoesterase [Polyangiaceae bacterium]
MTAYYAFNGDADGLCALQQLRLSAGPEGTLITGVKRDIALLERVSAASGDECTVLDISLDVNRLPLLRLLEAGVRVRYFDHHFAGEIPAHANLESHVDTAPNVCTSLLVDLWLGGRARNWAVAGAFGDSLAEEARKLAEHSALDLEQIRVLEELGVRLNYNAYGELLSDLHVSPALLAEEMIRFVDPVEFARSSALYAKLAEGYLADMEAARRLEPARQVSGALLFMMPDAAWARRVIGTLANDLARAHLGSAVAIVSPKSSGYVVSIRVPRERATPAEVFCRRFPTGGGRRTAAGINHLPASDLERFVAVFESEFRTG